MMLALLCRYGICVVLLLAALGPGGQAEGGAWRAGVARVNITPPQPMWMSGYASRNRPASGKLTDLWAKALVLEQPPAGRAVLITLDLVGIDRQLSASICRQLETRYGFARQRIAICCSHTHTGPVVAGTLRPLHELLLDQQQRAAVEAYAGRLRGQVIAVVGEAIEALAPVRLAWASGRATFAVNRRENREADVPALRAQGKLKGPSDHDVPVLALRRADDRLLAVLFGYACHATVLSSYEWSGDYPGFAQIELERAHPGCTALFWAGCGADQNPLPRRSVELARRYGKELATAVDDVLAGDMAPVGDGLRCRYREVELPLAKLPTREQIARDAQSGNVYVAARAKMLLATLAAGGSLPATYPYPIETWQLGSDVRLVFLGGEVVVDYALRLKGELDGVRTWVAGYANDVMAYIASRRVLREGGYEGAESMVYYGLPTVWAAEIEEDIVREVHRQLAEPL